MQSPLTRQQLFPEPELPASPELLAAGRRLAQSVTVGACPFLTAYGVASEADYKRRRDAARTIMLHAQIGYRSLDKSRRAYAEICERVAAARYRVDRYGICLDWSMGYPASQRAGMPRGTGLILAGPEEFAALTASAPVAPHFGDFVIGTPAAVENTAAALAAGATSIGNLGQYFTFRPPRWYDDIATTAATVTALALCAAQPVEVLIHSNLDDGFAALFTDLACTVGAVLLERYLVEELIGGRVSHCYGHTFAEPLTRLATQRALAGRLSDAERAEVRRSGLAACITCTDVHEYGKLLLEAALRNLGVRLIDGGVSADPDAVVAAARQGRADFIAVSTYNGVALTYLRALRAELARAGLDLPIFIGGKLNQVPDDGLASMPVDVSAQLRSLGAFVCSRVEDMPTELVDAAAERNVGR